MSRFPRLIVLLAARLLPSPMRDWGRAMEAELLMIDRAVPAFFFALGCLGCALRQASGLEIAMDFWNGLLSRPRHLAALCASASTGLGLAYLAVAGAPVQYIAVNAAALAIGFLAIGLLAMTKRISETVGGMIGVALAGGLLLTSLWGVSADGVTRWISAGGLLIQPSLLLLPVLAIRFAQSRNSLSTLAILIAALALALQPDRAMAGALAAGMAAIAVLRPGRNTLLTLAAALAGLAVATVRPDPSRAMPFVDQVFYSAFTVHPLAGMAVLVGAALMIVPAFLGYLRDAPNRATYAAFLMFWLAAIVAAALGNYPTPLVGYSGSAIVGYMISLIGLPRRAAAANSEPGRRRRRPGRGGSAQIPCGLVVLRVARAGLGPRERPLVSSPSASGAAHRVCCRPDRADKRGRDRRSCPRGCRAGLRSRCRHCPCPPCARRRLARDRPS